jgi:stage V sporulation protein B
VSKQTFMQGTLILVVSGLINKVLGFIYRISLTRLIGDEGIGLFQMAFPILTLVITLATLGLNVAISKHVSEAEALHDESRIRSILLVSMGIVLITSFVLVTFMVVSAPLIARYALTDQRAIYALMGIAPTIPIVAAAHIFRGYFQGRQNMFPSSAASVIEQVVRIFTVLFFASLLMPYGVEFAAAGGMIGMVVGEFAGLCLMLYHFKKDPSRPLFRHPPAFVRKLPLAQTVRGLFRISMPVTASRLVGHVTYAFEPILVAQSLALAGIATGVATSLYGQLAGMVIPLVYFPSFLTHALSVSLVPAISEAAAVNNDRAVYWRLKQSFRLSLIVGAPAAAVMTVMAEPLCVLIYGNAEAGRLMQLMAPFTLLWYLQGPFAAVLQGLDRAKDAMRNSIIGSVVKSGLIFILGSQPALGIDGVVIAMNTGIVIVTLLHMVSITRLVSFTFDIREIAKVLLAMLITGWICYFSMAVWLEGNSIWWTVPLTLLISGGVYCGCVLFLRLLVQDDVIHIPVVGKYLALLLPKRY